LNSVFFILILLFSCQPVAKKEKIEMNWTKFDLDLPEGIEVFEGQNKNIPLKAWVAKIDLNNESIVAHVLSSSDVDKTETPSQFMDNSSALIVMNGGYFISDKTPAQHVGLLKTIGHLEEPASPSIIRDSERYFTSRGAFGLTKTGKADIAWSTTINDSIYSWEKPIKNRPGFPIKSLPVETAEYWDVFDAVHAGPVLISNGNINVTVEEEVFFNTPVAGVQPRSAIGYTEKNQLIMMVVDGRQPDSRGVYLEELALMLDYFDCHEALNLDGGRSSAMVADTRLLNRPSGLSSQREVMSAIGIFYNN
jgi:exopolysaccharide biosynthesis protein|tara:strand:+ start:637 stop:1557 length:921 start_codon:yes stop_codon:yes gene_type:complete